MVPRDAIAYLFFPILTTLYNSGMIKNKDKEIEETINLIESFNPKFAMRLAKKIKNKIPIIYTSNSYYAVAYRLKTQINENAKRLAFVGIFSEVNHNEVEAKIGNKFSIIIFRDTKDDKEIIKQIEAFIRVKGPRAHIIELKGKNNLAKIFYGIHFGDWISYYLAKLNNIKIKSTNNIEAIKKMIK